LQQRERQENHLKILESWELVESIDVFDGDGDSDGDSDGTSDGNAGSAARTLRDI